ncbi:MAG: asparaginase [Candidatus Zixiibacteriota bacterium]
MHEIVARVYRGEGQESVHHGAIAVVNDKKELIYSVGEPDFMTQSRSEAKPMQAIPLILSGAADRLGLTDKQLAIMCGSHTGTEEHVETVRSTLHTLGLDESYLQCGTHPPFYLTTLKQKPETNEPLSPLQHNCSGKHSGFLALTKDLQDELGDYLNPKSRTQQMVLDIISRMYAYPKEKITIGIDGCSAPVFGVPLRNTAIAYATLANQLTDDEKLNAALRRIVGLMDKYPEMISGEGRFDLALARTFPGNVVDKAGAEGMQGIAFRNPKIGIAVKILDGAHRAQYVVIIELLRQLGLLENVDLTHLQPFMNPVVKNWRGLEVGRIIADFELKKAS